MAGSPQQPLMYDVDDENACLRRNGSGSNSGYSVYVPVERVSSRFTRFRSSGLRPFGDYESASAARGAGRGSKGQAPPFAGSRTATTGRSASQGNAAKPGGRAPPSVPAWCLRQTPRPTGTAHVTLTFGSQVYYQYYVFGISYYDGVSLYVRLRLGIPSRLPPACPRRGSLLKPWYPSLPHALYSRYM